MIIRMYVFERLRCRSFGVKSERYSWWSHLTLPLERCSGSALIVSATLHFCILWFYIKSPGIGGNNSEMSV